MFDVTINFFHEFTKVNDFAQISLQHPRRADGAVVNSKGIGPQAWAASYGDHPIRASG
jgi:hypothetical protein